VAGLRGLFYSADAYRREAPIAVGFSSTEANEITDRAKS
jgi:hypothetical protein